MERMLETFKATITPAQAMKLFAAPKDPKRTWAEHYMYHEVTLSVADTSEESDEEWILDSGFSRHLVKDATWLEDAEKCDDRCVQPNGEPLIVTKKGTVTLLITACGVEQTVRLSDVYYARNVVHNLISYGQLDKKGYTLTHRGERRVVAARDGGKVAFDVELRRNVLMVSGRVKRRSRPPSEVIMAALGKVAAGHDSAESSVQKGTLMEFHLRLGHLNYDAVGRLARDPSSGIELADHRRVNCLNCAQGKQAKNRQVFLAKTKDAAAKQFEHFLVFFEKRINCSIHVLRTDSGDEYRNVDLFCKETGVARQRSEANNQASNGKAEHMNWTIMNMARCMVFACGLPLSFWGDAVQYAAYILNRSPTNSNPGHASPMKILTKETPSLGEIVVFSSPCTVYREPKNENFSHRAQHVMIVGIGEETKGYRVYLPKDQVVITTQHVKNIETLSNEQNIQVQRLYLDEDEGADEVAQTGGDSDFAEENTAGEGGRAKKPKNARKKTWQRDRHVTRSVARKTVGNADASAEQEKATGGVVNSVVEADPKNYWQAMRRERRDGWKNAMVEELRALEENGVWRVVKAPRGVRVLHTKWVYKTKLDAGGGVERLKAWLMACGNERELGVNYKLTFAGVMGLSSVNVILALARKWRVPAKHGDVPNAFVKADKEAELDIFIHLPKGMDIAAEILKKLGVADESELELELKKALYGLKQADRLCNKLLHKRMLRAGFRQSITDMCAYYWRRGADLVVVGVYVDDLLVTGTNQVAVDAFFGELTSLSVKNLGSANKFLGMRVTYSDGDGYNLDQEVAVAEMLKEHGMEDAHGVRTPIGAEWNDVDRSDLLPTSGDRNGATVARFQSLVGSRTTWPPLVQQVGCNVALSYHGNDFTATLQTKKKFNALSGSFHRHLSHDTGYSALFNYDLKSGQNTLNVSGYYTADKLTTYVGKIESDGHVSLALVQKIRPFLAHDCPHGCQEL